MASVVFCSKCQQNQALLVSILAEYLPDENHPDHKDMLAAYDTYRKTLEGRYPQVCQDCLPHIKNQIQNAGYAAKADHLRRLMVRSKSRRSDAHTLQMVWSPNFRTLAKWMHVFNTIAGLLWHSCGIIVVRRYHFTEGETYSWVSYFNGITVFHNTISDRLVSTDKYLIPRCILFAEFLTLLWNLRLKLEIKNHNGRPCELQFFGSIRAILFVFRSASLYCWQQATTESRASSRFHTLQLLNLVSILLAFVLDWKTAHITRRSPSARCRSFVNPLPSVLNSGERTRQDSTIPIQLETDVFDGMAHGLSIEFQELAAQNSLPTCSVTSNTARTSEKTALQDSLKYHNGDDMDWMPTQRRFVQHHPLLIPNQWSYNSSSIKPERDPFDDEALGASRSSAHTCIDTWSSRPRKKHLHSSDSNFSQQDRSEMHRQDFSDESHSSGESKDIDRNANIFHRPKLKYEYYGTMKVTGLENMFKEL